MSNNGEDEESQIEITNEEFNTRINKVLEALSDYTQINNVSLKDLIETIESFEDISAVSLTDLIQTLGKIGCTLENIDVFCLFTKYKFDDEVQAIDYEKLEADVNNFYGHKKDTKSNEKLDSVEEDEKYELDESYDN